MKHPQYELLMRYLENPELKLEYRYPDGDWQQVEYYPDDGITIDINPTVKYREFKPVIDKVTASNIDLYKLALGNTTIKFKVYNSYVKKWFPWEFKDFPKVTIIEPVFPKDSQFFEFSSDEVSYIVQTTDANKLNNIFNGMVIKSSNDKLVSVGVVSTPVSPFWMQLFTEVSNPFLTTEE